MNLNKYLLEHHGGEKDILKVIDNVTNKIRKRNIYIYVARLEDQIYSWQRTYTTTTF